MPATSISGRLPSRSKRSTCGEKKKEKRIGRGGVQDLLDHRFFNDLDIDKLIKGEVDPPYKPEIADG